MTSANHQQTPGYESLPSGEELLFFQLDIDAQRADFFQQYVEGLRHSWFHTVIAIHDVFVHLGTAVYIVGLDGKHFLQCVRGAISFQRPHFHLTEALTTELSFTTQRLLSNQTIRTGRTRMHLVINQVVQFQHVHVADSNLAFKLLTGTAVKQGNLTRRWQATQL